MRIEEVVFDKEFHSLVEQYKPLNESQILMEEIQDKVADAAKRYTASEAPEAVILRDPEDSNLYVAFITGDGKHVAIRFLNGKVVEERQFNSFSELMRARDNFIKQQGYVKVNTESWYKRNWKLVLSAFVAGAFAFTTGPTIVAWIINSALFTSASSAAAQYIGLSGLAKIVGGGLSAIGFHRAIDYIKSSN